MAKHIHLTRTRIMINQVELNKLPQDLRLIPVGGNKNPLEKDWTNKGLSPAEFIEKFQHDNNVKAVGVITGKGYIAVDIDGVNAGKLIKSISGKDSLAEALPKTPKWTSGKEGRQGVLYRVPEQYIDLIPNIKTFIFEGHGLELRYNGHQSVITGVHPDTGSYKFLDGCSPSETEIVECPEYILKLALDEPIDLFTLINAENQELILKGTLPGEQDNKGRDLAWHLVGQVNYCKSLGIKTTAPSILLEKYISNCQEAGKPWTKKDIERWLGGAEKKAPTLTLLKPVNEPQKKDNDGLDPEDKEDILKEVKSITHRQKFDISRIFPKPLADEINYQASVFGQPGIIPAAILLTIVSSLLGTETKIVINHATKYIEPALIWLGLVGESDSGKSPLMRLLTKPLDKLQAESYETYSKDMERYKEELAAFEENKRKKGNEKEDLTKPTKPNYRVYSFGDFTTEAIVKYIQPQPEKGSVILVDELAGFIKSMDQYRGGKGSDRQKWLSLYNGDSLNVVRVGNEPIYISHTCLSIAGGIQPSTLKRLMGNEPEEVDGFWPRFTYLLLKDSIFPQPTKEHSSNLDEFLYNLYKILDNLTPKIYGLTLEAWGLWLSWHNETESVRLSAKHPAVKAIYRKSRNKAARFALIIHILNAAYDNMSLNTEVTQANQWERLPDDLINKETLLAAIEVVRYTISETLSIYGDFEIGINPISHKVKKFLEKFKDTQDWITAKMINKAVFYGRSKAEDIRKFMTELTELGYCDSNGQTGSDFKIKSKESDVSDVSTNKTFTRSQIESDITPDVQVMSTDVQVENNGHTPSPRCTPNTDITQTYECLPTPRDINGTSPLMSDSNIVTVSVVEKHRDIRDINGTSPLMSDSNGYYVKISDTETSETSLSIENNFSPRECVKKVDNRLEVDLEKLDLNYSPTVTPPKWEPTKELQPYQNLSKLYLDIETTGLEPKTDRVIMVGVRNHQGQVTIYDDADEKVLLQKTIQHLNKIKPYILIGHNLFNFDLPFIMTRCKQHGVSHSFKLGGKEKTITASSFNGSPIKFIPVYFGSTQIIDTFQQVCIWDKTYNKLTSYNLKSSVLTLKLREEKRLELSNTQIQECYQKGDLETIKTYLKYDLEDTELLGNFLIPIVYYQLKIVPDLSLQELATASPALKAQKIHQSLIIGTEPIADNKVDFEGAKVTLHNPGLHRNVAKVDVSSLYPSVMLTYGICSKKDPQHKFLGVLEYMTQERLRLKKLAKEGNLEADHQQNALKTLINGSYGFLGTGGYSFNDYEAAALVTAYGRKILNLMEDVIKNNGGILIESDTDGVIFSHTDPETVVKGLSYELPDGIKVDLEYKDCVASILKAKNYIIYRTDWEDPIIKGSKRTDIPLLKEFKKDYIKAYAKSEDEAQSYYEQLLKDLSSGEYPIEKLTVTRKIGKAEKTLVNLGIGQVGEIVSFWKGTNAKGKPVDVNSGSYNVNYYVAKIKEVLEEMLGLE